MDPRYTDWEIFALPLARTPCEKKARGHRRDLLQYRKLSAVCERSDEAQ